MIPLAAVPSLDDLRRDPARACDLPPQLALEYLAQLSAVLPLLVVRCMAGTAQEQPDPASVPPPKERYLSVEQVTERFGVTPRWLYRHKTQLPHSQPTRKTLLFPEDKITRWFANRKAS